MARCGLVVLPFLLGLGAVVTIGLGMLVVLWMRRRDAQSERDRALEGTLCSRLRS
jgi:hypothetical protein